MSIAVAVLLSSASLAGCTERATPANSPGETSQAASAPSEQGTSQTLPGLPQQVERVTEGATCKELGANFDFGTYQGFCVDEQSTGLTMLPEVSTAGIYAVADTSTLAITFYCSDASTELTFAVSDMSAALVPVSSTAQCAPNGQAASTQISIPAELVGKEVAVYPPVTNIVTIAAFAWL